MMEARSDWSTHLSLAPRAGVLPDAVQQRQPEQAPVPGLQCQCRRLQQQRLRGGASFLIYHLSFSKQEEGGSLTWEGWPMRACWPYEQRMLALDGAMEQLCNCWRRQSTKPAVATNWKSLKIGVPAASWSLTSARETSFIAHCDCQLSSRMWPAVLAVALSAGAGGKPEPGAEKVVPGDGRRGAAVPVAVRELDARGC